MRPPTTAPLYPLLLEPVIVDRIWGGTRLGQLLRKAQPGGAGPGRIGETWESATEASIANGPFAGRSLGELAHELGPALLGRRARGTPAVPFPLLAKFIEADQVLSVQVHPDDAYAQARLDQPVGKTETWYIIEAAPGAVIYHGLRDTPDRDAVARALASGGIRDSLRAVPVRAGDSLFTPAGTVHAIGEGIILYELQQYSDVTFRLYDWDRLDDEGQPRELHLEQGLEVLDTTPPTTPTIVPQPLDDRQERLLLVACRYFALELLSEGRGGEGRGALDTTMDGGSFHLLSVLDGSATIGYAGGATVEVGRGQTALLPATLGPYRLLPSAGCRVLRAFVPDLTADVVAPLRARGVPDEQIAQLGGGFPAHNDLLLLLAGDGGTG